MYLHTLDLTDFRNYADLRLELAQGRFIVQGDNAQGKSNLCEAIRLLATMRTFRTTSDRELVRWGAPGRFARIAAEVERATEAISVEIIISLPPPKNSEVTEDSEDQPAMQSGAATKRVRVNGAPRRAIDCVGLVKAVIFEPADLDLVTGPPAGRRRFLDVTLCQISRSYCRTLTRFQRVLEQRAALLRRLRDGLDDPRALGYWDQLLAELALPIITERAGLIARCNPPAREMAGRLGMRALRLEYQPSFSLDLAMPMEDAVAAFRARLASLASREMAQGVNLLGPHRDDLGFFDGGVDLATYGSRGQQRGAVLALKLAELDAVATETGDEPILVLDDVLSELDATRRAALLAGIGTVPQVILTTAEPDALPANFVACATLLTVQAGTIGR